MTGPGAIEDGSAGHGVLCVSAPGARLVAELGARGIPKAGQVPSVGRAGRGENPDRSR